MDKIFITLVTKDRGVITADMEFADGFIVPVPKDVDVFSMNWMEVRNERIKIEENRKIVEKAVKHGLNQIFEKIDGHGR